MYYQNKANQKLMLAKRRVKTLAKIYDLEHKIDFANLDDDYYASEWEKVLTKYGEFVTKARNRKFKNLTLYNINNVKYYNNDSKLIDKVRRELHEGYDNFPDFESPVSKELMKPHNNTVQDDIGKNVSTTAHIIDVDYEYVCGDMKILMYTRDVDSSRTNLILCDYYDYFYIELTDEVTMGVVKKAVNNYVWFLKNVRYPEAAKRYCQNRLTGTWKDKVRHEIPNSAPCDDPFYDARRHESQMDFNGALVLDIIEVDNMKSMYGYQPSNQRFAKIITANPTVTDHLFKGLSKKYIGGMVETKNGPKYHPEMKFYEATTDIVNKFLTANKLAGCVAVSVEGTVVKNTISTCDRAIHASSFSLAPDAPFYEPRVMFYDIECLSFDINVFPSADICPCIQISYLLMNGTKQEGSGVLCYKETPGYDWYETEEQMLIRFAQIILEFNPDAITGFNSNNFDMPYIIDRMRVLGIYKLAGVLSRRKNYYVDYKRMKKQSKQFGTKEIVKYVIPGRIMMDQFEIIKGDPTKRLRSYSLKSICAEYLGDDNKEDLAYKEIPTLFKHVEGRQRIASYCLQDTLLLHKIDQKMMLGITTWGMTKVLGVTPDVTLNRGLVHKLMSKLKQYTERYNFLIPSFTHAQKPVFNGKYQGAFVLDPDIGYYEDPVVVLDFASLYPALMIGWNLCYTTIVHDKLWMQNNPDKWEMNCGIPFVTHKTHKGIVPRLEEEMARQRKLAKKKMANAKDVLKKHKDKLKTLTEQDEIDITMKQIGEFEVQVAIYDSEQLANKIIMNSLYGMLGSPTATVPCVDIAKTITGLGRENLLAAKDYVEAKYCEITGERENCKVIYGDSVMPDTPLLVKVDGNVQIVNAEQIGDQYGIGCWRTMDNVSEKEYMEMPNDMYAWSSSGWTRVYRVMRHQCGKKLMKVTTHTGIVTCTEDHSLITDAGVEIRPNECIVDQTRLLHKSPQNTESNDDVLFRVKLGRKLVHNKEDTVECVDNYEFIPLTREFAMVLGMFHGDGYIKKTSWAINNNNLTTITKCMKILNATFTAVKFTVLDVRKSSGVYKLVASTADSQKGVIIDFVKWFRSMSYYKNDEKMVHPSILSSTTDVQRGYLEGLYDSKGQSDFEITQKGKRSSLGISTLLYMVGYKHVVVDDCDDKYNTYRLRARMDNVGKYPSTIKSINPVTHTGFVYDLTTENHHFQAGVGNMIVHNTDSIFIKMPGIPVTRAIHYGQQLDKRVQEDIFSQRPPMRMEYEKTYSPFIITRRKGYCGAKYEFNDKDFKVSAMGFQIVRRDSAQLCTKTMKTYFDYIFKIGDKKKAADSVRVMMTELFGEYLPLDDFVITKKIAKAEYKSEPPHVTSWKRMVDRVGKAEAPAIGERFEYVVTKMNKKLGIDMKNAIVDLQLVQELEKSKKPVQMDKDYYFQTYIYNPMVKIMQHIHGKEETKQILNPKAYERKETVSANKNNLLGFFGKKQVVTKKRFRGLGFDENFLKEVKAKRRKKASDEGWELIGDEDETEKLLAAAELTE